MIIKLIKETLMLTIVQLFIFILQIIMAQQNCLVLRSSNSFGGSKFGSCFQYNVIDLKQMIVHTEPSLVGFKFTLQDGTTKIYIKNSANLKNLTIDLTKMDIIGVNIYIENGVKGLQFQLYDWNSNTHSLSEIMGQSSGCFYYLNSTFMNIEYFQIYSIQFCVDDKGSNYFSYFSFSYLFSQCPFRNSSTNSIDDMSTFNTEISTSSSTKLTSETSTLNIESTNISFTTLQASH